MSQPKPPKPRDTEYRFRITQAWPGYVVPIPDVYWASRPEWIGERVLYAVTRGELQRRSIPDELTIRELLDVDVEDKHAVFDFVATYGVIDRTAEESGLNSFESSDGPGPGTHWIDIAMHLLEAQTLARHYIAMSLGEPTRGHWAKLGRFPNDEEGAAFQFVHALNNGIKCYSMRFEAELTIDYPSGQVTHLRIEPEVDLYSAMCLQIANLLVDDVAVKKCALCGSHFVRQRDRAERGQHRTRGVMFCSRSCARAQANRDYRRRKRQEN